MKIKESADTPVFNNSVKNGRYPEQQGLVAYYTNRFPYSEYPVRESLIATAKKRNLPLTILKLETREQTQAVPTPATIFSLFLD